MINKILQHSILIATFIMLGVDNPINAQGNDCNPALFADLKPGFEDSSPKNFTELNGWLYFTTLEGLWRTDGTASGTILMKTFVYGAIKDMIKYGNSLIISTKKPTTTSMIELWICDGVNTTLVKDFPNADGFFGIQNLTPVNGFVLFTLQEKITEYISRKKLWRTDGTEAGTILVKDIDTTNSVHYEPHGLFAFNDNVFFRAGNTTTGQELWKTDGTSEGTVIVTDLKPGLGSGFTSPVFAVLNNELYFPAAPSGYPPIHDGLWKTDGTESGTVFIKEIFSISELTNINNMLYFKAYTTNSGYGGEPWISDGTPSGTYMLKDINPGAAGSDNYSGYSFRALDSKVVFTASDGVHGNELWITDGTEPGTYMVKDINPNQTTSAISLYYSAVYNGFLYFSADDGTIARELWRTDGTEAGTTLVANLFPSSNGSFPNNGSDPNYFTVFNGNLFFSAKTNVGVELWSCGTELSELSIPKVGLDNVISVYPNPSESEVFIASRTVIKSVELKDLSGKIIYHLDINDVQAVLNIYSLNAGVYLVETVTNEGIYVERIVKKN